MDDFKVDLKVTTKEAILANARWVYQRAHQLELFQGDSNTRPTALQRRVVADILCSLGWNAAKSHLTKSLSTAAWWLDPVQDTHPQDRFTTILNHITITYVGRSGIRKLIDLFKKDSELGCIPCQQGGVHARHRYWLAAWAPFRLRCRQCKHELVEAQAFRWFAEQINIGYLPLASVGLSARDLQPAQQLQDMDPFQPRRVQAPVATDRVTLIFNHLSEEFKTKPDIQELVAILKNNGGKIPCQRDDGTGNHRYNILSWMPVRFRCALRSCNHKLTKKQAFQWFAQLVDQGHVSLESVNFSMPEAPIRTVPVVNPRLPVPNWKPPQVPPGDVQMRRPVEVASTSGMVNPRVSGPGGLRFPTRPVKVLSHNLDPVPVAHGIHKTNWVSGDGNCQFHAFIKARGLTISHSEARAKAVEFIRTHEDQFRPFIHGETPEEELTWDQYLANIAKHNGELESWGDNLTLQALCTVYDCSARVLTKGERGSLKWNTVGPHSSSTVIWLWADGTHYENLIPVTTLAFP